MIRRPPRSTHCISSAASDVYKRQTPDCWKIIKTCVNILIDQKFNLETVVTTVHSQSPLILISGKVTNDLNIDGGRGSIGPGSRQAIVIGRAIYLFIRNILNGKPNGIDGATQGHPGKITFCVIRVCATILNKIIVFWMSS